MKIDHLETIHLRYEYPVGFTYAGGTCTARLTSLVLVHTDTGQVGIGPAYSHPGLLELILQHQIAPLLIGVDPSDVEAIWLKMYRLTRWYGRKGVAMTALGAIDTALWDLRGQALDQPIWRLLGGETPACPAYASALLWKDPPELAEEAGQLVDSGFRRVKMRLGRGPTLDFPAARAVRNAIGDSNDLIVDGSMRYDPDSARHLAQELASLRVFWFEEPFEPEQLEQYAALRTDVDVSLAAGENEFGVQGFAELIRHGAVDIVQPDASRCGGISEVVKTAKLAAGAKLEFATHSWSDAIAIMANAHVVASAANGLTVEIDRTQNPFVDQLLVEPLEIEDGILSLSDRPGLGIQLNPEVIDKYALQDPMSLPDGVYSDMVFGSEYDLGSAAPLE